MKVRTGVLFAAVACAIATPSLAAEDCAGRSSPNVLTVQITKVRAAKGEIAVTIYPDDPRKFLAPHGKLLRDRVKAEAPTTTACFYLPQPGTYAIALYHDENGDKDFNRSAVGMPTEGYGFSNDAPTKFSLPAFDTVRFKVGPGPSTTAIRMRYPH
jgi:uncharacterized protein (DUF2141 family)